MFEAYNWIAVLLAAIAAYRFVVPAHSAKLLDLVPSQVLPKKPVGWESLECLKPYKTQYYLFGPKDGIKVLFIHGISTPASMVKSFLDRLALSGFRVLAYDLYGRGYSCSPGVDYDDFLYIKQIECLLGHVGWDKCHLIGYSMGGGIASIYTSRFPSKVRKLFIVAPVGLMQMSLLGKLAVVPYLGAFIMHLL